MEQKKSILHLRLFDYAWIMEISQPNGSSSDGIHFDKPKGIEWLIGVFQKHIKSLESDLLETDQFTFGPPPRPSFFTISPVSDRLGERIDSRCSSLKSKSGQPSSTTLGKDVTESSTPQSSLVLSVVIVEKDKIVKTSAGGSGEAKKARYLERVRDLSLEDPACRREVMKVLELMGLSHEDLNKH